MTNGFNHDTFQGSVLHPGKRGQPVEVNHEVFDQGVISKIVWWTILPNGKFASFYNIWFGKGSQAFKDNMREDFASISKLMLQGLLHVKIAKVFPLHKVAEAMEFAESRTAYGKVILTADG